jgi:hypothetical protein
MFRIKMLIYFDFILVVPSWSICASRNKPEALILTSSIEILTKTKLHHEFYENICGCSLPAEVVNHTVGKNSLFAVKYI